MKDKTMVINRVDKFGYKIPKSWDKQEQIKEKQMAKLSNVDKQSLALMLIGVLKEKVSDVTAKDISSIMSTAYTIARKGANGKNA